MKTDIITIHASGDITGTTDTRRINDAALALAPWGVVRLVEEPEGGFHVNDTIVLNKVRLECDTLTDLTWRADTCEKPLIRMSGSECFLRNLRLNCQSKCRGVLCTSPYATILEHVHIRDSRQVGLDLLDCWGSYASHVVFANNRGVAMWMRRCNSSHYQNIRLLNCSASDWPADLPAEQRAAITMETTGNVLFESACCEGCAYADVPIFSVDNYSGELNGLRFERNVTTGTVIRVIGHGYHGRCLDIRNVSHSCDALCKPESLVEVTGQTMHITVSNVMSKSLSGCVLKQVGPAHIGNGVERCDVDVPYMVTA